MGFGLERYVLFGKTGSLPRCLDPVTHFKVEHVHALDAVGSPRHTGTCLGISTTVTNVCEYRELGLIVGRRWPLAQREPGAASADHPHRAPEPMEFGWQAPARGAWPRALITHKRRKDNQASVVVFRRACKGLGMWLIIHRAGPGGVRQRDQVSVDAEFGELRARIG